MSDTNGKKPVPNSEPVETPGKTWHLAPVTPGVRQKYAGTCRARARQRLLEDRPSLEPEQYQEWFDQLEARIDAGDYDWGPPERLGGGGMGKAVAAYFGTEMGKLELFQLLLEPAHGEVSPEDVVGLVLANPEGARRALRLALGLDPNPPPPDLPPSVPGTTPTESLEIAGTTG